jgi:dihydrofolate synthase/folylpolyglutamate synthase
MIANDINIPSAKIKYGLDRTYQFLELCNNPQKNFPSIQIIGTNGKGTVAVMLSNILKDCGYKVGTFTSPHLVHINERISINNNHIEDEKIHYFLNNYYNKENSIEPSFFELMTVMAMWYFSREKVDIAILETGLGGRLDSITACENSVLVFTSISMDHHNILGASLKKIVSEKARAIINNSQECISFNQGEKINEILQEHAQKHSININFIDIQNNMFDLKYLRGNHQALNAHLAKEAAVKILKRDNVNININKIINSINNTSWYGRFQIIQNQPVVIYDVAHNNESLLSFINCFSNFANEQKYNKKYLIIAFEDNKKIKTVLRKYEKYFDYIVCSEANVRASMSCKSMRSIFSENKNISYNNNLYHSIVNSVSKLESNDIMAIIGSHFIAPTMQKIFENCFAQK